MIFFLKNGMVFYLSKIFAILLKDEPIFTYLIMKHIGIGNLEYIHQSLSNQFQWSSFGDKNHTTSTSESGAMLDLWS